MGSNPEDVFLEMFSKLEVEGAAGGRLSISFMQPLFIQELQEEDERLTADLQRRKQVLEDIEKRKVMLEEHINKKEELISLLIQDNQPEELLKRAKEEKEKVLEKAEEVERLTQKRDEMMKKKQERLRHVEKYSVYKEIMERLTKNTKFQTVEELADHIENLAYIRDKLYQKEVKAQEKADQQRKTLVDLEDQHTFMVMQKNLEVSQLQAELQKIHATSRNLEKTWRHILETAAQKTLKLGQIKMATLNMYEMIGGKIAGEDSVDINDTEKQQDWLKMFYEDHTDILRRYQTSSQKPNDGEKKNEAQKTRHAPKAGHGQTAGVNKNSLN